MKQILKLPVLFWAISLLCFAFMPAPHPTPSPKATAMVKQDNGLFVFIESQPVNDYETLGTVKKTGMVWKGGAQEMVKIMTRRAKDDYPTAEAIIFDDLSLEHGTVIKFK